MSILKISKHSDVLTALDLVKEEVDKEARRIFSSGGDALKAGKIKPAKEAIAYAEKLAEFVAKVQKLGDEWKKLEAKIDAAAPEVKEIVQLPRQQKEHKTGFIRKVTHVSPKSNFSVKFADGRVIADPKAFWVMAKTIETIGAEKVSSLGIMCGGEPLVTNDKSLLKKHPSASAESAGGWFVKTHSGTKAKIGYVTRIAKALKIKLTIGKA